jgi:hypothetical protein
MRLSRAMLVGKLRRQTRAVHSNSYLLDVHFEP